MVGSQLGSHSQKAFEANRGSLETAGVVELSVRVEACARGHSSEQLSSLASRERGAGGKLPGDKGGGSGGQRD